MPGLVTADLHLNINRRDAYRHAFQAQLREQAKATKADYVIIAGDLTDDKDHHSAVLVNQVADHIAALARICEVIVLMGNHDYTSLADTPFFAFLRRLEGVFWVSQPTLARDLPGATPRLREALGNTLFLPHTPDYRRDWAGLHFQGLDWIIAHNTFNGADIGGRKLEGIPTDIFAGSPVMSGDIHVPQTFGPITYVGAPYTVDFGDDYAPRIIQLDGAGRTDGYLSIPVTGPQKRLLEINSDKDTADAQAKKQGFKPGDILKVRIELGPGAYARWAQLKQRTQEWGAKRGYIIHEVLPVVKTQPRSMSDKAARSVTPKSDQELLKSYARSRGLDEQTIKTGLSLLKKDSEGV